VHVLSPFVAGALAILFVGIGHLSVVALRRFAVAPGLAERALDAAMRAHEVRVLGRTCNVRDLNAGYSLALGVLAIGVAALDLAIAHAAPEVVAHAPALTSVNLVTSLILLGLAVRAFPVPPIVLLTLASGCFGLALSVGI
jgi:hypothetical protein